METICVKMEKDLAKNIEKTMKKNNYVTKTEFVREAIRENIQAGNEGDIQENRRIQAS